MKTLPDEAALNLKVAFFIFEIRANACTVLHSTVSGIVSIANLQLATARLSLLDAGEIVSSVVNPDKFGQNSMPPAIDNCKKIKFLLLKNTGNYFCI